MRLLPESCFPLRPMPDVAELQEKMQFLADRSKLKELLHFERNQLIELIENLEEIKRRLKDDWIYYMKPNKAQMRFVTIVCYMRIFQASNKTGKTEGLVYDYGLKCIGKHPAQARGWFPKPPVYMRLICSDFGNHIKLKMLPLCQKLIPQYEIKRYDGDNYAYHFKNGSILEMKSNEQDTIKFGSVDRHGIGADEPFREDILGENQSRLVAYNGHMDLTQTPDWKDKAPWVRIKLIPKTRPWPQVSEADMTLIRGTYKDNEENLSPEGIKKWIEGMTDAEKEVRLTGDFPPGSAFLFADKFTMGVHTCQPFKIPTNRFKFRSIDLAGLHCPVVCLWAFIGNYEDRYPENKGTPLGKHPILYIYRQHYKRGWTIDENAREIIKLTGNEKIELTLLDPKSGSVRDEKTGLTRRQQWIDAGIESCVLGVINVDVGLQELSRMMAFGADSTRKLPYPQVVIFESCKETIKEMREGTTEDLTKVDAMHCISPLRWLAAERLLQNFVGDGSRIPGAIYDGKEAETYRKNLGYRSEVARV